MPNFTIKKPIGLTSQKSCTLETQAQYEQQQQASRCSDCGYLTSQREHLGCLRKAVAELDAATGGQPQASAAQSAPEVDRETIRAVFLRNGFTVKEGQTDLKPYVYAAAEELLSIARAAWQRTQAAPVVHVSLWTRLTDRMPDPAEHGRVLIYTEGYDFGGEQVFDVVAETLNECFFESSDEQPEVLRFASHWMPIPAVSVLAAAPARPAERQDQGEVQRLREALEEIADPIKFMRARLEDGEQLNGVYAIQMAESGNYLREIAKRALAASTGQEVKK